MVCLVVASSHRSELARGLAAFPYGAQTVALAPPWAVVAVLFVFGLVVLNFVIVIPETVSDVLCFVAKLLSIAVHGGIWNAHRYDDDEAEPRRIVGLLERLDRRQLEVTERYEAYLPDCLSLGLAPRASKVVVTTTGLPS